MNKEIAGRQGKYIDPDPLSRIRSKFNIFKIDAGHICIEIWRQLVAPRDVTKLLKMVSYSCTPQWCEC